MKASLSKKRKSSKRVLVVAAHPDDEVLGCGGSIAHHALNGDEVHVLILAEGITSRDRTRNPNSRKKELGALLKAATRANQILGVRSLKVESLPDNRMDSVSLLDIIKIVESTLDRIKPHVLYTHHSGDLNIDHRKTHEAVVTAARPLPNSSWETLLFFEIPSSTESQTAQSAPAFTPQWFHDITKTLPLKLKALRAYSSEMKPWPHPRSLKAVQMLANWRGASVGVAAAEAFILGRHTKTIV